MTKVKYSILLKPFRNFFVIIFIVFCIWMVFFDTHSVLLHRELNNEKNKLEEEKEYYLEEIDRDNSEIQSLSTEEGIEKYGRERYKMKAQNEDIYLIEYEDSLDQNHEE